MKALEPPFHEDPSWLDCPNFYHDLEDILFKEVGKRKGNVMWLIHCPMNIFGFSPSSLMNLVGTLCVYVAICRREVSGEHSGLRGVQRCLGPNFIAKHQIWAKVDPHAKMEDFNYSNRDVLNWKNLLPSLAKAFGVE